MTIAIVGLVYSLIPQLTSSGYAVVVFVCGIAIDDVVCPARDAKPNLADVKTGDSIQVGFVQTPNGQFLAKSVIDSGRPPANQTSQPARY